MSENYKSENPTDYRVYIADKSRRHNRQVVSSYGPNREFIIAGAMEGLGKRPEGTFANQDNCFMEDGIVLTRAGQDTILFDRRRRFLIGCDGVTGESTSDPKYSRNASNQTAMHMAYSLRELHDIAQSQGRVLTLRDWEKELEKLRQLQFQGQGDTTLAVAMIDPSLPYILHVFSLGDSGVSVTGTDLSNRNYIIDLNQGLRTGHAVGGRLLMSVGQNRQRRYRLGERDFYRSYDLRQYREFRNMAILVCSDGANPPHYFRSQMPPMEQTGEVLEHFEKALEKSRSERGGDDVSAVVMRIDARNWHIDDQVPQVRR